MFTQKHVFATAGIVAAIILLGIWLLPTKHSPYDDVTTPPSPSQPTTFFECAEQGNVVLESYPRQCRVVDGRIFVEDIGNELDKLDSIRIDMPRPNTFIASPLIVAGRARGTWFFEGSFPLLLADTEGNIITEGFATAEDGWMTEDFIPYSTTLIFTAPENIDTGILTLRKDNPSGLPKFDDALKVPVRFR